MSTNASHRYSGLWRRLAALVLDFLLFSAVFFPVTKVVKGVWLMGRGDHDWNYGVLVSDPLSMIFLAIIVVYFVVLEGLAGATVGKLLVGIRVVDLDGRRPGLGRSAVRNVLRVVDSLPAFNVLGVVLIMTSVENARFGDRVAGTRVVVVV